MQIIVSYIYVLIINQFIYMIGEYMYVHLNKYLVLAFGTKFSYIYINSFKSDIHYT